MRLNILRQIGQAGQVVLLGGAFLLPLLGAGYLFGGEEMRSAEIAREMIAGMDFLRPRLDYQPAWERLPLFPWMQAISMSILGAHAYAARLPNALCGILALLLIFRLGVRLYHRRFAWLWVAALISSFLPMAYFRSGIEAPWSGLLAFLALTHVIFFYWDQEGVDFSFRRSPAWYIMMGGLFGGLAVLLRGPMVIGLISITLGVYWLYENLRFYITTKQFFLFFAPMVILPMLWLSADGLINDPGAATAIIAHQWNLFASAAEEEQGFWAYHFLLLFFGCFPASIFAIRSFLRLEPPHAEEGKESEDDLLDETDAQNDFRRWMRILLWVVLVFFTLYSAKAPHFPFLAFFPLSYLAAWTVLQIMERKIKPERWFYWSVLVMASLYILVSLLLPWQQFFPDKLTPWLPEYFIAAQRETPDWLKLASMAPGMILAASVLLWLKNVAQGKTRRAYRRLFTGAALFALLTLVLFIERIPHYAEGAAIEFAQSKANEDCYIFPYKYASAAPLFYGQKRPSAHVRSSRLQWLLWGEADKHVYFIARGPYIRELQGYADMEELYMKNGYAFFKRIR